MRKIFLLYLGLLSALISNAQLIDKETQNPLHDTADNVISDLPWSQSQVLKTSSDSSFADIMKSIKNDMLLSVKTKNSQFSINPEVLLAANFESESGENYFAYGGGAQFRFDLNKKLSVRTRIIGFQQDATATDSVRGVNNLLPGVYQSNYASGLVSTFDIRARVAFEPSKYFHFEAGLDNNFVGDGYHSIIMGNDVSPYPFAMISTSFWKLDYNVQYHFLKDVAYPDFSEQQNKYMTTHQLNFRATPKLHFYVWEAVVWKQEDSVVQRGYDMSYLNPIIFFRPVEFQLGSPSPDNVLIGFGFRYQPLKWLRFYGQGLLDEFYLKEIKAQNGWWANKFAFQLGFESKFSLKEHHFSLLGEFNMARPFTYSHISSMQNYGHRLHSLAHPLGANFGELLFSGSWKTQGFGIDFTVAAISVGTDSDATNQGQNIYRSYTDRVSEYGHNWLQGDLQKNITTDLRANYVINKAFDLKLSLGLRSYPAFYSSSAQTQQFNELYVRISTFISPRMRNLYRTSRLFE
jgi:hypothetical protein